MFKIFHKRFTYFFIAFVLFFTTFVFANIDPNLLEKEKPQHVYAEAGNTSNHSSLNDSETNTIPFLQGDTHLLSYHAPQIVSDISRTLYEKTGVQVFINVIKDTPGASGILNSNERFSSRRNYENTWISKIDGKYAVIFLFYNDHSITLKSNLEFLNTQRLLEDYAYPYLPAVPVGSEKYDDGVNEGISNLYLALAHTIANHYSLELAAPKPLEQPSDVTKVIIYAMLIILIGLFILVRFGLLAYKNKKG